MPNKPRKPDDINNPPDTNSAETVGSYLRRQKFTLVSDSLERLSQADPTNIHEVVASQIGIMAGYYHEALDQTRRSFAWAIVASIVGLGLFLSAIVFVLLRQPQSASIVSLIAGALIQVIAGLNFYLYGKASVQFADFQERLERTQRFMLAESICSKLERNQQDASRIALVEAIAGITPSKNLVADGLGHVPSPDQQDA